MSFGGWSIPKELYDTLVEILPTGKTILELGSGEGTAELLKRWNVVSIEDDLKYVDKAYTSPNGYTHTWIYAPIKRHKPHPDKPSYSVEWYSKRNVEYGLERLDNHYDLILVDGPNGKYGRKGFEVYYNDGMFKKDVPIIIDDLQADKYLKMSYRICNRNKKSLVYLSALSRNTSYGVIRDDIDVDRSVVRRLERVMEKLKGVTGVQVNYKLSKLKIPTLYIKKKVIEGQFIMTIEHGRYRLEHPVPTADDMETNISYLDTPTTAFSYFYK